jgi:thiol-disulfide isomerase/thioredoxin
MPFHERSISPLPRKPCCLRSTSLLRRAVTVSRGLVISGVMFLCTGSTSHAQGVHAVDENARARQLVDEVVKAYKALPAYVETGQVSEVTRFRGKQLTKTSPVSLAFARPNRLALRSATTEVFCDGKQLSIAWAPLKRYIVIKAPESISLSTFTGRMDEVTRTVALSGDQPHFPLILALLSGGAQTRDVFSSPGSRLVVEPDRKLDGKMLLSLFLDRGTAISVRLLIDPATKLIRQIQEFYPYTPADLVGLDKEEPPRRFVIETSWSALSIQTEAAPENLFAYQPRQEFTRVGNFKNAFMLAEAMFAQPLVALLGNPAPDFTLNLVDSTGSIRKVSKAELAGKVVVVAYWSMRHEPCFEALREIQKIVQAASANDKVVLVALNVDEDPADIKEMSARVREALKEKKVAILGSRGCMVAVDPSVAIPELLPTAGLPAVILLDGNGIVQTSHVGAGAELTGTLPREIETLLEGNSLERPEFKELKRFAADESRPTILADEPVVFAKIEELGGIVIRAGGGEPGTSQLYIQLDEKAAGDDLLAKLVPHLKQIKQITGLHLQNTHITDAGLEQLKGMSNIISMNLEGTEITDRGLDSLKTISSLKYLILKGTRVTEGGILALKRSRPELRVDHTTPAIRGKSTE